MSDEQSNRNIFVIPQRRAGKHFNEVISQRKIEKIKLETAWGAQLANLPIQINVNKVVPRVFRLPMQAGVAATSALARVFGVKITFGLKDNES